MDQQRSGFRSRHDLEAEVRAKGTWLWTLIPLTWVRVSCPLLLILWVASSGCVESIGFSRAERPSVMVSCV